MALKVYDRMNHRDEMIKEGASVIGKIAKIRSLYKKGKTSAVKRMAKSFKQSIERFREKSL